MSPGNIVILNGASSSGKTSILKALQDVMDEPYLDAGIDRFIWMLPRRYLDRPLWDDVLGLATCAGDTGLRLFSGMHQSIAALSRAGNHVVADHVLVEPAWVVECAALFCDLPAYLVGVRCPLEVLEQRERGRKDRTLGQARAQFPLVHARTIYDLEVDTSVLSPLESAGRIKEMLLSRIHPTAFKELNTKCNRKE
jgi:chloramphenicol 3-O phosphotransferase